MTTAQGEKKSDAPTDEDDDKAKAPAGDPSPEQEPSEDTPLAKLREQMVDDDEGATPPTSPEPNSEAGSDDPSNTSASEEEDPPDPESAPTEPTPDEPAAAEPEEEEDPPNPDAETSSPPDTNKEVRLTDEEYAALGRRAKTRINQLYRQVKEGEPLVEVGRTVQETAAAYGLKDGLKPQEIQYLVGVGSLLAAQDQRAIPLLENHINDIRQAHNLPVPTTAVDLTFEGELPQPLRELVEVYGVSESDVRLLAAAKAYKEKQSATPPPAPAPSAPPTPRAPAPEANPRVEIEQAEQAVDAFLQGRGIVGEEAQVQFLNNELKNYLLQFSNDGTLPGIPPADRLRAVRLAVKEYDLDNRPPPKNSGTPPRQPHPQPVTSKSVGGGSTKTKSLSPLEEARNRFVG